MARRPARSALVATGAVLTVGVLGLAAASPALSASGDAQTVVRQSVQTLMDPSGGVKASRVYTQVQSSGTGDVTFVEQLSGSLRNLNGFGSPATTEGDQATWNYTVDGLSNQRTLQNFPAGDLPITVKATATLDGQPIEIADIVGKSGLLAMTYEVENVTGEDTEITWTDGAGVTQRKTVKVPLPYVGSMEMVLPDSYAEISAPGASIGGTGRNSTQLSYTLLMYPPLGDTKATITYEARVTDAEVPGVSFTFLPTPPSGNPTTASALEQYKGGQETGAKLTDGATQIDSNLLKLADGAGQLNDGIAQLLAGAEQLSTGLNETAVPGANQLADGSQQVADGNAALYAGLVSLTAGINQLYAGVDALPDSVNDTLATDPDYQRLIGTLTAIIAGIGTPSDGTSATLEGGLNLVKGGLTNIANGLRNPNWAGAVCDPAASAGTANWCGVGDVNEYVADNLNAAAASGGDLDVLATNINGAATAFCGGNATCLGTFAALASCINGATTCNGGTQATIKAQSLAAAGGLTLAYGAIDNQILPGINSQLIPGVNQLKKALYNSPCNPAQTDKTASDFCGISQALALVKGGIPQLVDAITGSIADTLTAAIGQPTAGCNPTATLACASAALTAGAEKLAGGSSQVADGNAELAAGLTDAADGSTQIADGLGQAGPGGVQIEDGANRLSTEGTKALIEAGQSTTNSFGEKAALMSAIDAAAEGGAGLPNGEAVGEDGTEVTTTGAFGYFMDGVSKSQDQNVLRFILAGLLLAGAAGAGVVLARR